MKLVDILARELKVWPEGVAAITQTKWSPVLLDSSSYQAITPVTHVSRIADDAGGHSSVGVTIIRAEWQAAVEALKAEQAAELKWPDGAEFMGTTKEGDPKVFYRNVGGDYEYRYEHAFYWSKSKGKPVHTPLIPRQTESAVEWDGTYLPPVGIECEVKKEKHWHQVKILAHLVDDPRFNPIAIYMEKDNPSALVGQAVASRFRPIRNKEQIAAEEREKGIQAIQDAYTYTDGPCTHKILHSQAARLYDAGCRLQVAK